MKVVDLNVLVYAVNRHAQHHARIRLWLEEALNGEETIGFAWTVILGFLRLATNPRVFTEPLSTDRAIEQIGEWLAQHNTRLVVEPENHWEIVRDLLRTIGTAGNLTTDAHLASLAIANGATVVSCDADFSRFRHLRWENPLNSS